MYDSSMATKFSTCNEGHYKVKLKLYTRVIACRVRECVACKCVLRCFSLAFEQTQSLSFALKPIGRPARLAAWSHACVSRVFAARAPGTDTAS